MMKKRERGTLSCGVAKEKKKKKKKKKWIISKKEKSGAIHKY
jgi:hypothetical protein